MYWLLWYCWAILSGGRFSELRPIYQGCRALTFALARLSCYCCYVSIRSSRIVGGKVWACRDQSLSCGGLCCRGNFSVDGVTSPNRNSSLYLVVSSSNTISSDNSSCGEPLPSSGGGGRKTPRTEFRLLRANEFLTFHDSLHWCRQLRGTGALAPPPTFNCLVFLVTSEPHKLWHWTPCGCLFRKNTQAYRL